MNRLIKRKQYIEFHSMNELPVAATDLNGNKEPFSVSVLAYDSELDCWTIAWYNFDTKNWMDHSEDSLKFKLWCYMPNPTNFIAYNHFKLPQVKNAGYTEGITTDVVRMKIKDLVQSFNQRS